MFQKLYPVHALTVLSLLAMAALVGCADPDASTQQEEPEAQQQSADEQVPETPVAQLPAPDAATPEEPAAEPPTAESPGLSVPGPALPELALPELAIALPESAPPRPAPPEPVVPEPVVPEPALPEPALPEPALPEPALPEPAVPEPALPEPAVPEPAVPEPAVPEPNATPPDEAAVEQPEPLAKAELLVELPDKYNTPYGMCLLPNGEVLVSVPNINVFLAAEDKSTQDPPPVIIKITKDNKIEKYYDMPKHPVTGLAFPFGICIDAEGKNLYITDLQWFANTEQPGNNSRVFRVPLDENYNPAGDPVVVIEGMVVANAVIIRDGYLYVSDTSMVPSTEAPWVSGIFRVKLDEEGTKLTLPLLEDPHLIATMKSYNPDVGFGADGLTFDSKGNLYCGNFADGTLHKIEFDADGNPKVDPTTKEAPIFAKAPFMKSCDGIFCDLATDKIYVADSLANAVQIVSLDGSARGYTVQTLAVDEENDGSGGRLDQPAEVLLRGNEVIASNIDFPVPGGVNTTFDKPYTISVIKLDRAAGSEGR